VSLVLSKIFQPDDLTVLAPELTIVDRHFTTEREQHPLRRWEYALALHACTQWRDQGRGRVIPDVIYDIGGAGSPFHRMVRARVIDPDPCMQIEDRATLAEFVCQGTELAACVFCLSVLEHVEDFDRFIYHLSCLVAPGGLLFLTMDYCEDGRHDWPRDQYHFSWMRRRIFNLWAIGALLATFRRRDFQLLGDANFAWQGAHVYDYTFASLALVKRS
jgi:hypothetical protein